MMSPPGFVIHKNASRTHPVPPLTRSQRVLLVVCGVLFRGGSFPFHAAASCASVPFISRRLTSFWLIPRLPFGQNQSGSDRGGCEKGQVGVFGNTTGTPHCRLKGV